ncbi:hypothetical protein K7X08_025724 [Anisodus acutangulus]|uniref:Uncharacterized protein n=1 Tax=Anisodus acutangulus TaxID=402998 RepID=A0A9Q1L7L5_9SOLA|nr:hypothetical protein K7X08_025724 [Anisodus acutangulus]
MWLVIEPKRIEFNPRKEITKAILEVIRRLYDQLYLTWGEILFLLRQDMFNEFKHTTRRLQTLRESRG